mgnify:CR=1 FL=1
MKEMRKQEKSDKRWDMDTPDSVNAKQGDGGDDIQMGKAWSGT